ncbi:hypothetical protein FQN52_007470 [Onygenales sp. PD_12]|nr:hypothetical protein FQN52_007470 [Onygenales sp. PD_12]
MTSHLVAIAKATLSAGLLRPDPTSIHRDEIAYFHTTLDRALSHCSPGNIQTCKSWLLKNVIPSTARIGALGKYLVTLSGSFDPGEKIPAGQAVGSPRTASAKRKRLHILYLLNDLLHHTKYHEETTSAFSALSGTLQPSLVDLISLAAGYSREKNPKYHRRLRDLLDIWGSNGFYSGDYINKLRETVENASSPEALNTKSILKDNTADTSGKPASRDAPYVMPPTHGDPAVPYHELPAGNLMPHIIPNSTAPIRPQSVKPLQFLAGPADESLANAVKSFLKDVDNIYNSTENGFGEGNAIEIDELGQVVIRDQVTGDLVDGETYYGWSRSFCEKMKKRRDGKRGSRSRSRSRSSSRSRSYDARKRRRYSDSASSDGRGRSRSRSSSIPPRPRSHNSPYSRSDSRSRTPPRRSTRGRSRSRSRSYSPHPSSVPQSQQQQQQQQQQQHPPFPPPGAPPIPVPPPQMQYPFSGHQQFNPPPPPPVPVPGPGGLFIPHPPPKPPGYTGPWPPPPPPPGAAPQFPPPPPHMNLMNMPGFGNPPPPLPPFQHGHPGGGPTHFSPPPPPPPHQQDQSQQLHAGSYHFPPPHAGPGQGRGRTGHHGGDANGNGNGNGGVGGRGGGRAGWGRGGWY